MEAVTAHALRRRFGTVEALAGVDLAVPAGTVHGLLGPNGAGKTTLVRILTTLLRATGGTATVAGFDVRRDPDRVRANIGLVGQHAAVDEILSGRQNLVMFGRLYHLGAVPRPGPGRRAAGPSSGSPTPGRGRSARTPAACAGGSTWPPA